MAETNLDTASADLIAQFKAGLDDTAASAMAERLLAAERTAADLQTELDAHKVQPDLSADLAAAIDRAEIA
ncbi:MAG: hypothetical protein ACTHOJ_07470 [Sphingomonas oligoaromativorans]